MEENNYIHILDTDGKRITSIVIDILTTKEKALERAKSIAPDCMYIEGGDEMLDEFLAGKAYVNGVFVDVCVFENALIYGNARVYGDARVFGNARVYENARFTGDRK